MLYFATVMYRNSPTRKLKPFRRSIEAVTEAALPYFANHKLSFA